VFDSPYHTISAAATIGVIILDQHPSQLFESRSIDAPANWFPPRRGYDAILFRSLIATFRFAEPDDSRHLLPRIEYCTHHVVAVFRSPVRLST